MLTGPDADNLFNIGDEYLAITYVSGAGGCDNQVYNFLYVFVGDDRLDLDLRQHVHHKTLTCSAFIGDTALRAAARHVHYVQAVEASPSKRFLDPFQALWTDYCFYLLHCVSSCVCYYLFHVGFFAVLALVKTNLFLVGLDTEAHGLIQDPEDDVGHHERVHHGDQYCD